MNPHGPILDLPTELVDSISLTEVVVLTICLAVPAPKQAFWLFVISIVGQIQPTADFFIHFIE